LTYAGLAQENCFSPPYLVNLLRLVTQEQWNCAHATEECNKYGLTGHPCFLIDYPIIMIGPDGLLLVVPTYLQSPFHVLESGCLMTIFILGNVEFGLRDQDS
jgi:hypothetical protein